MIRLAILASLAAALGVSTAAAAQRRGSAPPAVQPEPEDGLPLRRLPPQELPSPGCGLFLWSAGASPKLVLMARSDVALARVALAEGLVDLARAGAMGETVAGFPAQARFADAGRSLEWRIEIEQRADLTEGALIPSGSLSYTPANGDAVAVPVTGIIGCRG